MLKELINKKNKKYQPLKVTIIISLIILLFFSLAISVGAYERPEFTDGLTDSWHPGAFCIPCHYTLLSTDKAQSISNGCKCHDYIPKNAESKYSVDMKQIFNIHKDIVCIRCHVGVKEGANLTAADFHRIMSKEACLACHTYENGTYQKPQKTKCSDCHSGDPHVVHGKKLERMCITCHGDFAATYIANKTVSSSLSKPDDVVKEYPTIGQIISNLIESLFQIFR
jgi:Zn finger protein HypA/HybF involved in hydrogenase expression